MTNKLSKWTAAPLAAAAVAAIWMTMPATAQQQAAASDQALVGPGRTAYAQKCGHCHGPNMVTSGTVAPDLRTFPDDNARFTTTVKQGKNNMPPWGDVLKPNDVEALWAYFSTGEK